MNAGMSFLAELHVVDSAERRRSPRRAGRARGVLNTDPRDAVAVLIHDLSQHGFRATVPLDLAVGDEVRLALGWPKPFAATVVWRDGQRYGCEFRTPISAVAVADAFSGRMVIE